MAVVAPGSDSSASGGLPSASDPTSMTASSLGSGLAIWTDQGPNRCVLHLRGRLCADTVRLLDGHVDRLGCRWSDEVVVDLRSLAGIDDVGARLLVGLSHYVAGRGGRFHIEGASREILAGIGAAEAELEA